jgi:FtsH-binding integral membrane protein
VRDLLFLPVLFAISLFLFSPFHIVILCVAVYLALLAALIAVLIGLRYLLRHHMLWKAAGIALLVVLVVLVFRYSPHGLATAGFLLLAFLFFRSFILRLQRNGVPRNAGRVAA